MKKVWFLGACMLCLLSFVACGTEKDKPEPEPVQAERDEGRYQEEQVLLPAEISSEARLRLYQETDGIYLGAFLKGETAGWYRLTENGDFKAAKGAWLDTNERGSVIDCFSPEQGKRYVLRKAAGETPEDAEIYGVELWEDGKEVLLLDLELMPKTYFERIYGDKEGRVLLFSPQEGYLYQPGEERGNKLMAAGSCGYVPADNGKLAVAAGLGGDYGILDLQTGKFEGKLNPEGLFDKNTLLSSQVAKGENSWYFLTSQGIYALAEGEKEAELLIDAADTSIYLSDFRAESMVWENEESLFICTGKKIYHYCWTDKPLSEKKQLTLTSCEEIPALRDAVVKFNLQNIGAEVSYETLLPANYTAQEKADAVRNFNTRIMAGESGDIFALNGLPFESYGEKGLLLDLQEEFTDVLREENYYGKIISGYQKENKLFAPVLSFMPLLNLVKENGCPAESLAEVAAWMEKEPEAVGLSAKVYSEPNRAFFRKTLYQFYQNELRNEAGELTKEQIRTYLEAEKLLYNRLQETGKQAEVDTDRGIPAVHQLLYSLMREEDGDFGCLIGRERDLVQSVNPFREEGWSYQGRKQYVPGLVMGVSSQSKNQEEAKAFVHFLLKEEIQAVLCNGYELPVYKEVLRKNWEKKSTEFVELYGEQYEIKAFPGFPMYPITETEIDSYLELFERAEYPVEYLFGSRNSEPEEFVLFYERSDGYFTGKETLENAVEKVYEGLKTMEAERK